MATTVEVPKPAVQPVTSEQRLAIIARLCGEALYSCTGRFVPLNGLELSAYVQRIKAQLDVVMRDPRVK